MMEYILGLFLDSKYQVVWHNFETRMDFLISSLIQDEEQREYAINSLLKMMDVILSTKNSDNKTIAKNCDFDQSRNSVYNMVTYAQTKMLQEMFDKQIFYKLALVKIYGINDVDRKAARYALYTDQFAELIAQSTHLFEVKEMVAESLRKLAAVCIVDGKVTETAIYTCLLIKSLKKNDMSLNGLWDLPDEQEEGDEQQQRSVCMLQSVFEEKSNLCKLSDAEKNTVDDLKKLFADEK